MFDWLFPKREPDPTVRDVLRRIESLEFEWNDWYGKFRRLYAQMSRRAEREEAREIPLEASRTDDPSQLHLIDRQAKIQAEILSRRNHAVSR